MPDKSQGEVNKAIKAMGNMELWNACVMPAVSNRPDSAFIWHDKSLAFYIEHKSVKSSGLVFGGDDKSHGWRQGQIEYGLWHIEHRPKIPLFLAVMFYGIKPVENRTDKRLYIVPFQKAYEATELFRPHQMTMPFRSPRSLVLREEGLWLEKLWADYKVQKIAGGWDVAPILAKGGVK